MWKAFIRDDDYGMGINLFIGEGRGARTIDSVLTRPDAGFVMKARKEGEYDGGLPFMNGEMAAGVVQAILDAAWAHGMRPTGISGERGEIRRLEEHLADMRTLALRDITSPVRKGDGDGNR